MKKFFLLGITVLVMSVFCLTACGGNQAPQYTLDIDYVVEPDPNYIGSYSTQRCDLNNHSICWTEWGEWSSVLELVLDPNKEVCLGSEPATLRARSDYKWIQDGNCFQLEKKN
ncbi:hypothetical protein KBB69_02305 [Candidatus Dojkabacteria bacterium]|jgi:hypothetical protein|nr:hypothetical protein [Candidatus Dojkabacteria bacterium]